MTPLPFPFLSCFLFPQRNLLCAAITRGKKLVIVMVSKKALGITMKNGKMLKRFT